MELADGYVLPHFLGVKDPDLLEGSGVFENFALRMGEVKEKLAPTDQYPYLRYRVQVPHLDESGTYTTDEYPNCVVMNLFGGRADKLRYTLRPDEASQDQDLQTPGKGSKVLLLCINGDKNNAVIVGGILDQDDSDQDQDDGHHLKFRFNGVKADINDDGEFTLTFQGKTDATGKLQGSSSASGSFFKLDKQGSCTVATPGEKQFLKLDHQTGQATVQAQGKLFLKSSGVHIGQATEQLLQGTTYRAQQAALHAKLGAFLGGLAASLTAAGASLTAAVALPPLLGTPASAPILAAAKALIATGPVLSNMIAALSAFEAQSARFLSTRNYHD